MQESQLIPWIKSAPFEPFTMFLADGRTVQITHPESVMLAEYAAALYVFHTGGQVEVFDATHITSIRSVGSVDPSPYLR